MYKNNLSQFHKTIEIEKQLGNPFINGHLFSFSTLLELDEKSEFPDEQAQYLNSLSLQKNYIPSELGGYLTSFEELGYLFRAIYRRDVTLGLGYGSTTLMAAVHIFLAGSREIKLKLSEMILNGSTISIGYHEKNHGNDLLNNEVFAKLLPDNTYQLTGSKWVINNVTTSKAITTFVRTVKEGGPRGFSLLFIDKAELLSNDISYINKIKTHGVKGCRIGAAQFNRARIPSKAIIGRVGEGFELTVKAFQITRAVLPSMALGVADSALRLCYQYANARQLYGHSIKSISHVNETLVFSFINLLLSDSIAIAATRALHVVPEQMSVIGAIAKFQIPKLLSANLKKLSVIMGSRFYMREGPYGIFQKIVRDFPIVSLGHSSDVICLNTILPQLRFLLTKFEASQASENSIKQIFSLEESLPSFDITKLKLTNNGFNDIFSSLLSLKRLMEQIIPAESMNSTHDFLLNGLKYFIRLANELKERSQFLTFQLKEFSLEVYELGETYCKLFSVTCCYLVWLYNFNKISNFCDNGAWIGLALLSLFPELVISEVLYEGMISETSAYLNHLYSNNLSFSIAPITYL